MAGSSLATRSSCGDTTQAGPGRGAAALSLFDFYVIANREPMRLTLDRPCCCHLPPVAYRAVLFQGTAARTFFCTTRSHTGQSQSSMSPKFLAVVLYGTSRASSTAASVLTHGIAMARICCSYPPPAAPVRCALISPLHVPSEAVCGSHSY
jgi:hypothetical protein